MQVLKQKHDIADYFAWQEKNLMDFKISIPLQN